MKTIKKKSKKPKYNPPYDESKLTSEMKKLYRIYWEIFDEYFQPKISAVNKKKK